MKMAKILTFTNKAGHRAEIYHDWFSRKTAVITPRRRWRLFTTLQGAYTHALHNTTLTRSSLTPSQQKDLFP